MTIDREKLRALVRRQPGENLLRLLDRAIDLLPGSDLEKFIQDYARPRDLASDGSTPPDLAESVEKFRAASLRGEYYEVLDVKSKYHHMRSPGTQRWIAECFRLLDLCAAAANREQFAEARAGFEAIFLLLALVDKAVPDIVHFSDEHGSEQLGIHWAGTLPAWFRCLAATSHAREYACTVHHVVEYFAHYEWDRLLPAALACANDEQRAALSVQPRPTRSCRPLVLPVPGA